jgi:hypothetical protein
MENAIKSFPQQVIVQTYNRPSLDRCNCQDILQFDSEMSPYVPIFEMSVGGLA